MRYTDKHMFTLTLNLNATSRRLLPLYCASFLQSFVLWYVIEKLFMRTIGFNDTTIGVMAAMYSAVMLLTETPSGILADRWSRKGVLIIGSVALALSAYICGISHGVAQFIIGSMCWGIFFAMYSGTYDSIVYDTLVEDFGNSDEYEKYYGRVRISESMALVISSLLGGLIAGAADLRTVFYWTIPFSLLSIVPLVLFREPVLHKAETEAPLGEHARSIFRIVVQKGVLTHILLATIGATVAIEMLFEFTQLWYIAIAMPVALYGMANALLLAAPGLAGLATKWLQTRGQITLAMGVGVLAAVGLTQFKISWQLIALQTAMTLSLTMLSIILNRRMHDELPSNIRVGAASAVSTLGRVVFIPLAILFGYLSNRSSVFTAGWVLVALCVFMMFFGIKVFANHLVVKEAVDS